jgi:hypothetical protein
MPDRTGASAAKICARCADLIAGYWAVFLTFRKTRNRRAGSAQATGIQAEFKRDYIAGQQREAAFRKSPGC